MRITSQAKAERRERIIAAARDLFAEHGFEGTSTRALAGAAEIAAGTLFNYFPSKQLLALEILADAQREAHARLDDAGDLAEALFALIAAEMRAFEPWRTSLGDVFEQTLSPFAVADGPAAELRLNHLQAVDALLRARRGAPASAVELQLYWALYLGVLGRWSRDDSPGRADSLALLDQATLMFERALGTD